MNRKIITFIFLLALFLQICPTSSAAKDSTFSILFIDVGQGDSALVECDGHYMLIDGGGKAAGESVYRALEERGIQSLDYLVISHLHADHYGGLIKALTYATDIGRVLSNSTYAKVDLFKNLEHELSINNASISVPQPNDTFQLGSAEFKILSVAYNDNGLLGPSNENDSLVLLLTYKKTQFLFTGDIEYDTQTKIANILEKSTNNKSIKLIKMPHHGAFEDSHGKTAIFHLISAFDPQYSIISVGKNQYGHPDERTIELLQQASVQTYRTDCDGDILVRSNGKNITVETRKRFLSLQDAA